MQATLSRRIFLCLLALLGTTVLPWLGYGRLLEQPYEIKLGLDLKGGAAITYRVRSEDPKEQDAVLASAIQVTRFRVDSLGVSEVNILQSGTDQFTVELPGRGKEEIEHIKSIMSRVGSLEFRIVAQPQDLQREKLLKEQKKPPTPGFAWVPREEGGEDMLLEVPELGAKDALERAKAAHEAAAKEGKPEAERADLARKVEEAEKAYRDAVDRFRWTGEDLSSVAAVASEETPMTRSGERAYEIAFNLNQGRKALFGEFTGSNLDREMAIVLNGLVHTAPTIHGKISDHGRISSKSDPYTAAKAQGTVTVLQSGSLKVTPEEVSSFVVGPGVGEDSVRRGRLAVLLSCGFVIAFMAYLYRGAGWVANLAVVMNLVMTLGVLMFMGAALSLPGIAGLLLTLGMSVDANILVNERIREEKAAGKGLLQAIAAGYDRAFVTILDSNLTTVLTAVILYAIGTGTIRGFALTLILGLLISMFTSVYVTRTLFLWGLEKGILTEFRMAPLMGRMELSWMGLRRPFIGISFVLIVAGTAAFALREVDSKYDLEFTGGQRVLVAFRDRMTIAALKERIEKAGLGEVAVRTVRGRGSDATGLDLSTESDAFELTARIRDEAEGSAFKVKVEAAFQDLLLPPGIAERSVGTPDATGKVPFRLVANLATADATAEQVKELLAASPAFQGATDLKVVPVTGKDAGPGTVTLEVTGTLPSVSARDPEGILVQEFSRALKAPPGIFLSEPVPQSDYIGPGVARQLRDQAMLAVLLSLLAQIVYLRLRFRDFTYGFAAAIALAHDVLITLGALAICDGLGIAHVKISLPVIAAFLTLIGFSMNDTIVVFDRIRENLGRSVHPTSRLIDDSINQTFARSIRTNVTVFIVSLCLFLVNYGATSSLEGFGFVMTVGAIAGSYSSVAIAAPLLLFLPVYSRRLRALGTGVTWALMASLFLGLAIAFKSEGTTAAVGAGLACLLPAHWLWHLAIWLKAPDADALVAAGD